MTKQFFSKFRQVSDRHNFISRLDAMHLLQLNSKDFRRLCILKGIYPREPSNNKRPRGYDGTEIYYHKKDVEFLSADSIVSKYRGIKSHSKKISKARAYMDENKEKMLKEMTPYYSLHHVVRERYPTFQDALEDLDDALTLVFLFASMPAIKGDFNVDNELVTKAYTAANQFMAYLYSRKAVRKVFLSIKGVYVNAVLMNTPVLFIVPHKFSRKLPTTVDYELMQTFLEFYISLINHVLCRLYKIDNFKYPPTLDLHILNQSSQPSYMAYKMESIVEEETEIPNLTTGKSLFHNKVFFLGKETPYELLTLQIHSFDGTVVEDKTDKRITHIITDRDVDASLFKNVDVVQTQWVVDCCNFEVVLPASEYAPGKNLPPHVSPFKLNVKEAEYLPERMKEILQLKGVQAQEADDSEYVRNYMAMEDDQMEDQEIEPNDVNNYSASLHKEVQRDKDKEKKEITFGAQDEQKGLQRLSQTNLQRKKYKNLFNEKKDKIKKLAKIKQRRIILNEQEDK